MFSALNELTEIAATSGVTPAMEQIEILVDDLERDIDNRVDGKALSLFYGLSDSVWFLSELLQVTTLLYCCDIAPYRAGGLCGTAGTSASLLFPIPPPHRI